MTPWPQDAPRLTDRRHGVGNVLEQILHHDAVEALVVERQTAAHIALDNRQPLRRRRGDSVRRAVDAGVALEVPAQPGVAATDVEQRQGRVEMPRDVVPVAGLLVPFEVAHAGRTVAHATPGAAAAAALPFAAVPRPHHVVLNALFLDPGGSGGPETYLRGLAPALRAARPDSPLTVVTTISGAVALRDAGWPGLGIRVLRLPCEDGQRARRQIAEQVMLPRVARQLGAQVIHSLSSVAPIRVPDIAHVITLHDVNFIHHATFNPVTTWGLRQVIPRAARRADALIAVTAVARDDVCATLGLAPERFTVVPLGVVPPGAVGSRILEQVRDRFGLDDGPVVVCIGAKRPHKNQAVLVRALRELPDDVRLVLAGRAEPYEQSLRALAHELDLEDRVVFADWVSDEELEGLWSLARVLAVPTLAEGFGLPALEAMARGVPVAASDLPVTREVAGDWPAYFDPHDPRDAAKAIAGLLADPPDPMAARERAARYTWRAAAEATWQVYDRALTPSR